MYPRNVVKKLLDLRRIPHEHRVHPTAITAQQVAAAERIPGTVVAKTVVVKADNQFVMAVLPASAKVDFPVLRETLRVKELRLAKEAEFESLFPDSEVGAMPPFAISTDFPCMRTNRLPAIERFYSTREHIGTRFA